MAEGNKYQIVCTGWCECGFELIMNGKNEINEENILCTVLSGLAVFAFVGEAVAQAQINRSAYFWEVLPIVMN